jgi:hypothetical protein
MLFNKRGVVLITVIIWIIIIGAVIICAPRLYNWYVEQEKIKIIKSNAESVEDEIKSELIERHPILIWNDVDKIIKALSIQNPVTKKPQVRNGWSSPGDIVVYFDGVDTFTLDGISPDGNMLHLNIVIK